MTEARTQADALVAVLLGDQHAARIILANSTAPELLKLSEAASALHLIIERELLPEARRKIREARASLGVDVEG